MDWSDSILRNATCIRRYVQLTPTCDEQNILCQLMDDSILPSGKICSDFAFGASQWSRMVITLINNATRPALRAFRETMVTSDLRLAAGFARFGFSVASNHTWQ